MQVSNQETNCLETFEEHPVLARYKEGDNKDLGFWFIVAGFRLKKKNQKLQTRDRRLSAIGQKRCYAKVSIKEMS
jgi:hypothetical protein